MNEKGDAVSQKIATDEKFGEALLPLLVGARLAQPLMTKKDFLTVMRLFYDRAEIKNES